MTCVAQHPRAGSPLWGRLGSEREWLPGERLGPTTMAWALFQAGSVFVHGWLFGLTRVDYRPLCEVATTAPALMPPPPF